MSDVDSEQGFFKLNDDDANMHMIAISMLLESDEVSRRPELSFADHVGVGDSSSRSFPDGMQSSGDWTAQCCTSMSPLRGDVMSELNGRCRIPRD